jgi:hypothetical protein
MQRITIYGWIIAPPDPVHGGGSGSLVDLIYFISDEVRVEDIFGIIEHAGYKILSKKISGTNIREADRITVEDWSSHIKAGVENVGNVSFEQPTGQPDRYNYPYSGGMI